VARLADLAWIAGDWQGERGSTRYEERWVAPLGPVMTGQFRMVKDGRVVFYEFLAIEQDPTGPVLRMRHFGPGLIAWEDRDSPKVFPLVSHSPEEAVFDDAGTSDDVRRIIYRRLAPDSLLIRLVKVKDGAERHDDWRFARALR
jgi:hypothetical protein